MDEGKLPISLLQKIIDNKGFHNKGIIKSANVGEDVSVLNFELSKENALKYYQTEGEVFLVEKSDPVTFPTSEPGKYVVIVNANDLSCAGALPFGFLATIIAPPETTFENVSKIQQQIHQQCLKLKISIVGGHTEISKSVNNLIIAGHMFGFVPKTYLVPNRLQLGEKILMIGLSGIEGTGIILTKAQELAEAILSKAEIEEGILLGNQISISELALEINKKFQPSLIHDPTEGGIFGALSEIIINRDVGITITKKPPISDITMKLSSWLDFDPFRLISSGALIVSIQPERAFKLQKYLEKKKIHCSIIGEVVDEKGFLRFGEEVLEEPSGDQIICALENLEKIKNETK
ncbi:MAG: AIR synthase-related protein [Candidatus Heimdallarchaeaceae archaeon]